MAQIDFVTALLKERVVTEAQAAELRRLSSAPGERASAVVAKGWAPERPVAEALAEAIGTPAVVLSQSTIDLAATKLLPESVARDELLLPLSVDANAITAAAANVDARPLVQQLEAVTGRRVTLVRAIDDMLRAAIPAAYAVARTGAAVLQGRDSASTTPALTLVKPKPRSTEAELQSVIVGLSESLTALRAAARVEGVAAGLPPRSATPLAIMPGTKRIAESAAPVPVLPPPRTATPGPMDTAPPAAVLVVEDDAEIRQLIVQTLRKDGRTVIEAQDGTAALALLRTTKPALVVLDAMLPGVHGFEICGSIKRSPTYRDVPVMMVSAVYRGWESARDIQENHGADAFLEKPFSLQVLRATVAKLLGGQVERIPLTADRQTRIPAARAAVTAHKSAGAWEKALEAGVAWLELDPFDPAAHIEHGNLLLQKGDYAGAMCAYETAVAFAPKVFVALTNLASVYERLGFRRRADDTWHAAAAAAPDVRTRQLVLDRIKKDS